MNISVIIPVYNEEKYIEPCLDAFKGQITPPDEIIIVDNNCHDKTIEKVKKYPVRIVQETTQGMTPARNKGFDVAHNEILARCDADTHVSPTWVATLKEQFRDPDVVAVSGPVSFYDTKLSPILSHLHQWSYFRMGKLIFHHNMLFGPQYALRRSAWEKIRTEICTDDSQVHEDMDITFHLSDCGFIVFSSQLAAGVSTRRAHSSSLYFEYPWRAIKTIWAHR